MKCCICGKEIIGDGNLAEPVASGKCCDECNFQVIILRAKSIAMAKMNKNDLSQNTTPKTKGETKMAKCKMNNNAVAALAAWRAKLPKDANGKTIYPARTAPAKLLKEKKDKLAALMVKVEKLQKEIAALDSRVNKEEKKDLFNQFTVEELRELLASKAK